MCGGECMWWREERLWWRVMERRGSDGGERVMEGGGSDGEGRE